MQVATNAGRTMAGTPEGKLVEAARAGDSRAFGTLFDTWFDKVHDLSRRIVRDPGTAGEVAQDTFLAAWTRLDSLDDPDAFGGWLLRIARNKSLNRLEKDRRSVALDHDTMTTLTDLDAPDHDPLAHLDQAGRVALVWDAAAALGERDLSILDLHLRHGLGAGELAEELGTTANNAHQILFTLRKRLGTNVRALVLWRAGRPACEDLRRTLTSGGIATFDKQAVKVIDRHAQACDDCSRERSERLAPAALFQAASALEAAGVPMGGSAALGAGPAAEAATGGPPSGGEAGPGTGPGTGSTAGPTAPLRPGPTGGPAPRRRRIRLLAVAAVTLILVGAVLVLGGAIGGDADGDGGTELAAVLPGTSLIGSDTAGPGDDPTDTTGATGPATTASGGFEIVGADDADPTGPTTPPGPGAPGDPGEPGEPGPAPTTPGRPTSTSVPSGPTTTGPTTTGPTTTVPTTTTAPTTTAPTTTAPPRPAITTFSAITFGKQCRGGISWDLTWATTDVTDVVYGAEGSAGQTGPPTGTASICHPPSEFGTRFVLVATGPGGQVQQLITGSSGVL
jgi:RNA polymerase sigma factor (sigma-70 family)